MEWRQDGNRLVVKNRYETLWLEPWGTDALRVRATQNPRMSGAAGALNPAPTGTADIRPLDDGVEIRSGQIRATVNHAGVMSFFRGDTLVLREYYRNYDGTISPESCCLKISSREMKSLAGDAWRLAVRFESRDGEKLYGMGQYQQPYLDLKGCTLELAQRNSQVSVPFVVSSLGYGLLWNNPATGRVTFGKNLTEWTAADCAEMDYWITVGDSPAQLLAHYTEQSGRTPLVSSEILGLWQCKLRYRTQEEVLTVARKYRDLGIPLSVIVIDFFHWPYQGAWYFDKTYWPDVKAMNDELHAMGTKVVASVWPTVDKRAANYAVLERQGLLERTERGAGQTYDFQGDCSTIDLFNPEARKFLWETCKKNYADLGIDFFWLDNAEPDYTVYDFDNFRYYDGPAQRVGNAYPKKFAQTFYEGMIADGKKDFLNLIRCAWAGSQKYGTLVWSGDVPSNFDSFRDQLAAGLNMGLAGIPLWTTDIGGFMTDDVKDPMFRELLIRWYEFAVFTPILRMHGDRGPKDIPPLDNRDFGGGYLWTGQPNELWSYGDEAFAIMRRFLDLRLSLIPYIEDLIRESHETGAPLMRTVFYEYPQDPKAWNITDQYFFGSRYLVAPVMEYGQRAREVYLPAGTWESLPDGTVYPGGQTVSVAAPLDRIPVFRKKC